MISPFGFPYDDLFQLGLYESINQCGYQYKNPQQIPCTEHQEKITRGDDRTQQLGSIMCRRICQKIRKAHWVVADITEPNANVYYELGLAYGWRIGIVLIANNLKSNPYISLLDNLGLIVNEYKGVEELGNAEKIEEWFKASFKSSRGKQRDFDVRAVLKPEAQATILCVQDTNCPGLDLHTNAIDKAIQKYNNNPPDENGRKKERLEDWKVKLLKIGPGSNVNNAIHHIAEARICLFDVTHLGDRPNAAMFFFLGLAHATEREVIPLVNSALNPNTPFDIHGLWQTQFRDASELERELGVMLPEIDAIFKKDREDYPYHRIWDPFVLSEDLRIYTCAREMPEANQMPEASQMPEAKDNEDRGPRSNVDVWDFRSATGFLSAIAERYDEPKTRLENPQKKKWEDELSKKDRVTFPKDLLAELKGHSSIIIGAPEASDYAEAALAELFGIQPYTPVSGTGPKPPFYFVKENKATPSDHPRRLSTFYCIPLKGEKKRLVFAETSYYYDERDQKVAAKPGAPMLLECKAYAVITIGKLKRKHPVMVISGYTGVATFAAMELLTNTKLKEELIGYLQSHDNSGSPCDDGVNILISVEYTQPKRKKNGDGRKPHKIKFVDFKPIRKNLLCGAEAPNSRAGAKEQLTNIMAAGAAD